MNEFITQATALIDKVNGYLTNYLLVILLVGIGLFYSIRTRFVQVRCFGEGWRRLFGNISLNGEKAGKHGMSSFQALATAIAAQVGTGNIVGACGAILIGGPGAIFWMWVIAFFGMATIYAEATLAQVTKTRDEKGEVVGGPIYYIKKAFTGKWGKFLAGFFSVAIIFSLGFTGAMVQSNSIGGTVTGAVQSFFPAVNTHLVAIITGAVIAVLAAFIFVGGAQRVASVTEKIVPFMACLYVLSSLVIIVARIKYVPETFGMIFRYAFQPQALVGGSVGFALKEAISQGAKRGLFSNEAGMGSTPHAHAVAKVDKPHDQGVVAMIGVFIDTFIVLTMTALVVISTLYAGHDGLSGVAGLEKNNLAQAAFSAVFGQKFGSLFVAICLFFFAFSTIIGWNFFGKLNFNALFGNNKVSNTVYGVLAVFFVFLGSFLNIFGSSAAGSNLVWALQDFTNMLMVIPNALALLMLSKLVVNCLPDKNAAPCCEMPKTPIEKE